MSYGIYIVLFLSFESENRISKFLINNFDIKKDYIQKGMHLTVYYGRKPIPLKIETTFLSLEADMKETRFMVMAPGGENPRPELEPAQRSVGIRLTKRNKAISEILKIRRKVYKHEPKLEDRKNTTDWRNAFGARGYQPHVKLLRPGNGVDRDLTIVGEKLRRDIKKIQFVKLVQRVREF